MPSAHIRFEIEERYPEIPLLSKSASLCKGLRLLNQNKEEMIYSFVISPSVLRFSSFAMPSAHIRFEIEERYPSLYPAPASEKTETSAPASAEEERIYSFVISQNNNIPRIKGIINKICTRLGEKMSSPAFQCVFDIEIFAIIINSHFRFL